MYLTFEMYRFSGLYCCCMLYFFTHLGVAIQEHLQHSDCVSDPLHMPNTTAPIEPLSLTASYAEASLPQDPTIQFQIYNTLALYPLSIDSKNFAAIDRVFTCEVVANYSAPLNVINGLSNLQAVLKESLLYVTTQHSFSTQVIDVADGGRKAKSLTYFTATHFGQGDFAGQVHATFQLQCCRAQHSLSHCCWIDPANITCLRQALYAHGQYQDTWVRKNNEWRITLRNLVYMVSLQIRDLALVSN